MVVLKFLNARIKSVDADLIFFFDVVNVSQNVGPVRILSED